jgi:hypothetical protein
MAMSVPGAHGDADIRGGQSGRVIDAIARHADDGGPLP